MESGEDLEVAREVPDRNDDEPGSREKFTSSSLPSYLKELHILQFLSKNLIQWKKAPDNKNIKMCGNSLFLKLQKVKKYHVG